MAAATTIRASTSGGVLARDPLRAVPMAVRTALTITAEDTEILLGQW